MDFLDPDRNASKEVLDGTSNMKANRGDSFSNSNLKVPLMSRYTLLESRENKDKTNKSLLKVISFFQNIYNVVDTYSSHNSSGSPEDRQIIVEVSQVIDDLRSETSFWYRQHPLKTYLKLEILTSYLQNLCRQMTKNVATTKTTTTPRNRLLAVEVEDLIASYINDSVDTWIHYQLTIAFPSTNTTTVNLPENHIANNNIIAKTESLVETFHFEWWTMLLQLEKNFEYSMNFDGNKETLLEMERRKESDLRRTITNITIDIVSDRLNRLYETNILNLEHSTTAFWQELFEFLESSLLCMKEIEKEEKLKEKSRVDTSGRNQSQQLNVHTETFIVEIKTNNNYNNNVDNTLPRPKTHENNYKDIDIMGVGSNDKDIDSMKVERKKEEKKKRKRSKGDDPHKDNNYDDLDDDDDDDNEKDYESYIPPKSPRVIIKRILLILFGRALTPAPIPTQTPPLKQLQVAQKEKEKLSSNTKNMVYGSGATYITASRKEREASVLDQFLSSYKTMKSSQQSLENETINKLQALLHIVYADLSIYSFDILCNIVNYSILFFHECLTKMNEKSKTILDSNSEPQSYALSFIAPLSNKKIIIKLISAIISLTSKSGIALSKYSEENEEDKNKADSALGNYKSTTSMKLLEILSSYLLLLKDQNQSQLQDQDLEQQEPLRRSQSQDNTVTPTPISTSNSFSFLAFSPSILLIDLIVEMDDTLTLKVLNDFLRWYHLTLLSSDSGYSLSIQQQLVENPQILAIIKDMQPEKLLKIFCHKIDFDEMIFVEFLLSSESVEDALAYLTSLLKYAVWLKSTKLSKMRSKLTTAVSAPKLFIQMHLPLQSIDALSEAMMKRLFASLTDLSQKNEIPYNIAPLLTHFQTYFDL